MKTNNTITVQLNDGLSVLHTWSEDFEKPPTVGDTLKIDTGADPDLKGYKDEAEVLFVEDDSSGKVQKVILGAEPVVGASHRPTVVMNKDYIEEHHRRQAESLLRRHFEAPAFEWVESDLPQPIIDVHTDHKPSVEELRKITDEIRDMLLRESPLTVVR